MNKYKINDSDLDISIGKVICLARTYKKHAKEMKSEVPREPVLFLKPESSVIFDGEEIIIPKMTDCVHHEVELGVVIGKQGKKINLEDAMSHVLGYVVGLDITARDIQSIAKKKGLPWSIAKGFNTFAPISNVILKKKIKNPHNLNLVLELNGKIKQKANTKDMIFRIEKLIEYISNIMTLKRGDLILTGTPEGVGEIKEGDKISAKLENICSLNVSVKKEL